ncbi:MAG: preprotein translocase subunit SecA [Gammaproteobacteria bacterium]|nr:preprotein translocase subunit SecA [Gammaproteobacteria bacterium]
MGLVSKLFGSKNERELKRLRKLVSVINGLEPETEKLSDGEISEKRAVFASRLEAGESLDDLLPEAFALVREAAKRKLGQRIYDVQLMGGIILHEGKIAEMRTGEGKTLVATLPLYLNAISGEGVHLVTVNDYLARHGADWMAPVFGALGMSVGIVVSGQTHEQKQAAYRCDVTYGTNNEYGFDYLRDNMAFSLEGKAQRALNFAIVDEVDSILIDEARTPLIISGSIEQPTQLYQVINAIVPQLKRVELTPDELLEEEMKKVGGPMAALTAGESRLVGGDYFVDEKQKDVELTEEGHEKVESLLVKKGLLDADENLYSASNLSLLHQVHAALKAHNLYQKDVEYVVANNQVHIVDEHTGRILEGRRWSGGIHQAIEAKEGVSITQESQTMASTTYQNYFRLYRKLAGMTGTADTEAFEFRQIYGLDVVIVPTNLPMVRLDLNDLVFMTKDEKYEAIIDEIEACRAKKAPVLVGTASIESSETLSALLKKRKIPHSVLNAKFHEQEAEIIAQAGRPGIVTIATNMAGRGTDIILGGNWEAEVAALEDSEKSRAEEIHRDWKARHQTVLEAGGLHVIGTERHESRRIDNQLRGRAGRQGDPGASRFFLSLEDDLMRLFASDFMRGVMQNLGMEKGVAIEHRMVTSAIEKAQRKVEQRNFDFRKNILEYDDVANDQRQLIYHQRNELMEVDDVSDTINALWDDVVSRTVSAYVPLRSLEEQWDIAGLEQALSSEFSIDLPIQQWLDSDDSLHEESLRERIVASVKAAYAEKEKQIGPDIRLFEKQIMLQIVDNLWIEHLAAMDSLKQGIGLRAYAQKQPKQEYKREAFELFEALLNNIKFEVIRVLSRVQFRSEEDLRKMEAARLEAEKRKRLNYHQDSGQLPEGGEAEKTPFVRTDKKVGRNEPCPCGSGKKYKNCHGKLD